jgi:hypothetical protein
VAQSCQCPEGNCCAAQIGSGARFLGIDSSYIYWSGVTRAPLAGGPPESVAGAAGDVFAIGRTSLYFFGGGAAVSSVPLAGGAVTGVFAGIGRADETEAWLAADDTNVYVTYKEVASSLSADVIRIPLGGDGGTFTILGGNGEGHFRSRIMSDGAHVYWRTPGAVVAAPVAGGQAQTLASANATGYGTASGYGSLGFIAPLSMDSSSVYTVDGANIVRIAKATGASSTLAAAGGVVAALAADDTRIYWSESVSKGTFSIAFLRAAPLAGGGSAVILADDFSYVVGELSPVISDIVVDSANVYWAANGQVWRLAK